MTGPVGEKFRPPDERRETRCAERVFYPEESTVNVLAPDSRDRDPGRTSVKAS
ncbi:Unknown protein sequence [Pseudomonas syringae pv. aceris]|nr:Unknown protein sequence [Pseudomonas syringae pv. aceris]